jgi:ERCC4-type nuclease
MPGQAPHPNSDAPPRRGIYFLTHPRSASNLFQTMMSKQPGYQNSAYKLFDAGFATLAQLERRKVSEMPEEEREKLYEVFRTGYEKLEDELEDCAKIVSFTCL